MPQKIYKLCLIRGYKEAWYHLSESEKQSLWNRVMKNLERLGVKSGPSYNCRWSNDQYSSWFTMEYPSVEAAIADTAVAEAADLWRYLISETIMGIEEVAQAAPP